MRLFARRCLCRSRAVQAMFEDWQASRRHATLSADLEQLVYECIDVVDVIRPAWKQVREMLLRDPNGDDVESTGQTLKAAVIKLIPTIDAISSAVAEAAKRGYSIQHSAELATALRTISEVSTHLDGAYPIFDTSSDEEDMAAFKRGEYLTTEEMIREVQNSGVGAD